MLLTLQEILAEQPIKNSPSLLLLSSVPVITEPTWIWCPLRDWTCFPLMSLVGEISGSPTPWLNIHCSLWAHCQSRGQTSGSTMTWFRFYDTELLDSSLKCYTSSCVCADLNETTLHFYYTCLVIINVVWHTQAALNASTEISKSLSEEPVVWGLRNAGTSPCFSSCLTSVCPTA